MDIGTRVPRVILNFRWLVLAALAVILVLAGTRMIKLDADFSFEQMFLSNDPEVTYFDEFQDRFASRHRDMVVILHGEGIFTPEGLSAIDKLSSRLEGDPDLDQVTSITNVDYIEGVEDDVLIHPFVQKIPAGEAELGRLREAALSNRLYHRYLISEDGRTTAIFARIGPHLNTERENRPVIDRIVAATEEIVGDRMEIHYSGIPTIQKEYTYVGMHDMRFFIGISAVIICTALLITFRNFHGLYLPLIAVSTCVVYTLGLMRICGEKINIISNVIPSLLLVYGIANSIHLISRYYEELRSGKNKRDAVLTTIRHMSVACFMTSFTTAVGFFSLCSAYIHIIKIFGFFAGMGILFSYIVTILFIPIALSFHPPPSLAGTAWEGGGPINKVLAAFTRFNRRSFRPVFVIGLTILVFAVIFAFRVNIESYIMEELSQENPIVVANRIAEEDLAGSMPIEIAVDAGVEGGAIEPDVMRAVDALCEFASAEPMIGKAIAVPQILKDMHKAMNGGEEAYYAVPPSREMIAQYLLLYSMSGKEDMINLFLSADHRYARVSLMGADMGTHAYFDLKKRLEEKVSELFPSTAKVRVTGRSLLAQRALNKLIRDMMVSFFLAFGVIFLSVAILFRSVRVGLVAMLPNIVPLVATLGFMGAAGITLRTSTVIIFAIALGIAVDNTIHYLSRLRSEIAEGREYEEAMSRTMANTGRAILFSSIIMVAGFTVFLVSDFVALNNFGILGSLTLTVGLVSSMFFLPACVTMFRPWKARG